MGLLRLLPLFLLLLLKDDHRVQSQRRGNTGVVTHYGNCNTTNFGPGRCVASNDCGYYHANILDSADNAQCSSQRRPDLVCCPRERKALSTLVPTIAPTISSTSSHKRRGPAYSPDELPKYPNCGTSFPNKVFGGSKTRITEFPWTTLLEYTIFQTRKKEYVCGAAFIAQRWLITAAHCAHKKFVEDYGRRLTGARLGEWDQTTNPDCIVSTNGKTECVPPFIQASIDKILVHPEFDSGNLTHDIALLRLAQPVEWTQLRHLEAVCLPPARGREANQLVGSAVDVSGWGRTEENYALSDVKRKAMLHVQSLDECQAAYESQGYNLGEGQLCASGGLGVDSCSGDSGGPLTAEAITPQRDRFVYLAGVVSYGKTECGKSDFPGVYTRISHYMDWIEATIRENRGR
ncbi:serine protease easter-like [Drosophila tropicalis]|uniref:serine protease easter-like n=1 Tax=Drosophila tropicalis TaxID=46794 RepID=UPI0035AB6D6F